MYSKKTYDILNSSIKSAIFIDEKARDFYSDTPYSTQNVEEKLSIDLFKAFKESGKSLAVHKFQKSDLENDGIIEYLFNGRDLILLDWELDGIQGQEYSLQLLSKVVDLPYINFCCIYTRTQNPSAVPYQISSFFSGLNEEQFQDIATQYEYMDLKEIDQIINGNPDVIDSFFEENKIQIDDFSYLNGDNKKINILKYIYISLDPQIIKPKDVQFRSDFIDTSSNSFIINNTFIFILKKDTENDVNISKLIERLANEVVKNKQSFFQLLGLEMQSVFNHNEKFIDENILKSSSEALFQHRNLLFSQEKDDKTFSIIIKKLLIEHATLRLRTAKLGLLDSEFLVEYSKTITGDPSHEELHRLNTFYNAVTVKSINDTDSPNLNFGDVFVHSENSINTYYLCITALCDCYYPNKIEHNFYFVTGKELNHDVALKLGDTAFISFLPNSKAVYWGTLDIPKVKTIKNFDLSTDKENPKQLSEDIKKLEAKISKLEANNSELNSFLYKPFYVKPKTFNVPGNKIIDNKITLWEITYVIKGNTPSHDLKKIETEYITTLRTDYTQRIANHAFGHPARVGVDFVKL